MTRRTGLGGAAVAVLIAALAGGLFPARVLAAEAGLPPGIKPEQVAYLEESLGEGIGTADGKLTDMALEGLRATGKSRQELVRSLEKAALSAALSHSDFRQRIRIDAWTLAVKDKFGDEDARKLLRDWVLAAPEAPEAGRGGRGHMRARVRSARCAEAFSCLAYLKYEGLKELAEKVLRRAVDGQGQVLVAGHQHLQGAAKVLVELDREKGVEFLFALLDDGELSFAHRTSLLQACAAVLAGDPAAGKLAGRYAKLVDGLIAEGFGFDERRLPNEVMLVTWPLYQMPLDAEILAALERLRDAVPEKHRRWIGHHVRSYGVRLDRAGAAPAKGPRKSGGQEDADEHF